MAKNFHFAGIKFRGWPPKPRNPRNLVPAKFSDIKVFKSVWMNNQECKSRPVIMDINSDETLFYFHIILLNKCSGSCNDINNFHAKLFVPDTVKNMNIKVFNLISRTNETRYVSLHETCKCKCRLDASICNNKKL